MIKKLESWLFEKFAGKLVARAAVTVAAFVAGPLVAVVAEKTGIHIPLDQAEIQAAIVLGAHAAYEAFKKWRTPAAAPVAPVTPGA
jgi:hypothetical protein